MFKKFLPFIILIACVILIANTAAAQNTCLTPEMQQTLTIERDLGGIMLYAVPEVSEDHINHIRYILDRLLLRDDKNQAMVRRYLEDARVTFLVFEDGADLDEFEADIEGMVTGCALVGIIGEEVHYLGSLAEQHGMVDESFEDVAEVVYHYGIKKAYPTWVSRLSRAQRSAYADGRFTPENAIDPEPRGWWDVQYLIIGLEVYYNYWAEKEMVRNGEFSYRTKEEMQELDPALFALIEEIFPNKLYLQGP